MLVEIGVPKNLTGLIALPAYKKATRPSPEAIEKAVNWLKANHRITISYRENNLIDTTYIHSEPTIM